MKKQETIRVSGATVHGSDSSFRNVSNHRMSHKERQILIFDTVLC